MLDALISGNIVVDLIGRPVDRLPERGKLLFLEALETHPGGNGPNTAAALARLGARVAVAGRVGEDLFGRFVLERLDADGVDPSGVARAAGEQTGVTFVAVDGSGERTFLHLSGANRRFGPEALDLDRLPPARHLHYASYFILPSLDGEPAAGILASARARGMTTSLDLCWDNSGEWLERLRPCLAHVDLLTPNREEAEGLTGLSDPWRQAEALLSAGARAVVIKLGQDGSLYAGGSGAIHFPAFPVSAVDTTGAGDCFAAGFLYARSKGWELSRTLRFANACGALSVGAIGAVTGMRPAAEVEAWIDAAGVPPGEESYA